MNTPLTDSLKRSPPSLHGSPDYWGLAWEALAWLEQNVQEGMATLETGAGASTIVFAARGTEHEAVTPDPEEERRIRNACDERGIDAARVTFHIGRSHDVLPIFPSARSTSRSSTGRTAFPIRSSTGGTWHPA